MTLRLPSMTSTSGFNNEATGKLETESSRKISREILARGLTVYMYANALRSILKEGANERLLLILMIFTVKSCCFGNPNGREKADEPPGGRLRPLMGARMRRKASVTASQAAGLYYEAYATVTLNLKKRLRNAKPMLEGYFTKEYPEDV